MAFPIQSIANRFAADPDNIFSGTAGQIATIMIPAPKQVQYMSKIKYVDEINFISGLIQSAAKAGEEITAKFIEDNLGSYVGTVSAVVGKTRDVMTGRRDLDIRNSMFSSAEKRAYNLTFTLLSTTKEEARQVARIANMFHALSMPIKSPTWQLNIAAPYADRAYPPPLWRFGMGLGIGGNVDISWMGQTSFTVLQAVVTNTTAAGSSYMVEDPETGAKPLMTSFSLVFLDYEPMYRSGESYRLIPKSARNI
jgi:hypothetical protein